MICSGINPLAKLFSYIGCFAVFMLFLSCEKNIAPLSEYTRVFGGSKDDFGSCIVPSGDGGFIVCGRSSSNDGDITGNHGNSDAFIVKIDAEGNKLWQKCYGGSEDDEANCVVAASDGGFVFAGYTNSNDQFVSKRHGGSEFWVFKTDKNGNLLWQKSFGGDGNEVAFSITETADKGFALTGYAYAASSISGNGDVGTIKGVRDIWVTKISDSGSLLWQTTIGGFGDEYATSIITAANGNLMIVGQTSSTDGYATGNHGSSDAIITALTDNGVLAWSLPLGGAGQDIATDIVETGNNSFVVIGLTNSHDGNIGSQKVKSNDAFIVKINADKQIEWVNTFGGSGNDGANSLIAASDGGFVFSGQVSSNDGDVLYTKGNLDLWGFKVDSKGNKLWSKTIGGSVDDYGRGIAEVPGKGYLAVGSTLSKDYDASQNHGATDAIFSLFGNN